MKAQSQIGVTKTGTKSGFSVETDMYIKDGSDREAYASFDDEPREGKKQTYQHHHKKKRKVLIGKN